MGIVFPVQNRFNSGRTVPHWGRIDWTNPITKNLIGCWLPGISVTDLANLSPTVGFDTNAGQLGAFISQEGPGYRANFTNNELYATATPAYKSWTELSIYWRGYTLGASGANLGWMAGISYKAVSASPYVIAAINAADATHFNLAWSYNSTSVGGVAFTPTYSAGHYGIGGTWRVQNAAATVLGYQNGAPAASANWGAGSYATDATSEININGWHSIPARFANAICYIVCFWDRVLTPDEMVWIDQNPYDFIIPSDYEMAGAYLSPIPLRQKHFRFRIDAAAVDAEPTWGAAEDVG